MIPISSLVPNVDDLLSLEVEEVAGVLLIHLNSYGDGAGSPVVQQGRISQYNFFAVPVGPPEYPGHQDKVNPILLEAWAWLQGEGFLVRDPAPGPDWFFVSRRGRQLKSREDFAAYRKASLLPKGQLHPLVASRVYPAFLRGEYDAAVFQAFREVEVAVRGAAGLSPEDYGTELMRIAFQPANNREPGPLTDVSLPVSEQEAMAHLFAGAIGLYKNPQSHRHVPTDPVDAAEVIGLASHLLRIVDRQKLRVPEQSKL